MKTFIIIAAMLGAFFAGMVCRNAMSPKPAIPAKVFVTNYVGSTITITNTTDNAVFLGKYTDADLARFMGEGALIGYRLGLEDGRKKTFSDINAKIATNRFGVTYSTNGVITVKP